jgi:hypothetical protein
MCPAMVDAFVFYLIPYGMDDLTSQYCQVQVYNGVFIGLMEYRPHFQICFQGGVQVGSLMLMSEQSKLSA